METSSALNGPSTDLQFRTRDTERQTDVRHEYATSHCCPPLRLPRMPQWLSSFFHRKPKETPAQRLPKELWGQIIETSIQDGPREGAAWLGVNSVARALASRALFKRPEGREIGRQVIANQADNVIRDPNLTLAQFAASLNSVVQTGPDFEANLRPISSDLTRLLVVLNAVVSSTHLKSLTLNLQGSHVRYLATHMPILLMSNAELERLTVRLQNTSHQTMARLAATEGPTDLDLSGALLASGALATVLAADTPLQRTLRSLNLSSARLFDVADRAVLANNTTLRRLELKSIDLTDADASVLARNTTLDYIDVSDNPQLTDTGRRHLAREGRTVVHLNFDRP